MEIEGTDNDEGVIAGVIVTALGNAARVTTAGLADMQRVVGGYLEAVDATIAGHECTIWLNEEGKLEGLPMNQTASVLAVMNLLSDDVIVGDVLITGGTGPMGESLPIHPDAAALIMVAGKGVTA